MLERALSLSLAARLTNPATASRSHDTNDLGNLLEDWLLGNSEEALLPAIQAQTGIFAVTDATPEQQRRSNSASRLASKLLRRDLYDELHVLTFDQVPSAVDQIRRLYGDRCPNRLEAAHNRSAALDLLECDFGLDPGAIVMYCPEGRMNSKIAEVQLFIEGDVERFDRYEATHMNVLSGGHLEAQLHRFQRLWRVGFFIDPEVRRNKGDAFFFLLCEAVQVLILNRLDSKETIDMRGARIAHGLVALPTFHLYGRKVTTEPKPIQVGRGEGVTATYPTGAQSLLSFIQND
jgi:hypothetical protein